MKKPPTDNCPFCNKPLTSWDSDGGYVTKWYCDSCVCETDRRMPRYLVIRFKPDDAYQQEFAFGNYYIKNNYHGKETTICLLVGYVYEHSIKIPFKEWNLLDQESCLQQLKLYITFS